jgi:hypothetical protein
MHKPQLLKIGTSWGLVDEYVSPVPQFTVNRFTMIDMGNTTTSAYQVGFEVAKDNTFYIKEGIPFPVESILYDSKTTNTDARALYQVKLLSITNMAKNITVGPSLDIKQICSDPLLLNTINNTYSNQTIPLKPENNFTQNTVQNYTGNLDQNYTNEINFTTEGQILKAFKGLDGNITLNSTR